MFRLLRGKKGFTLVELIVVVIIVAILAAAAIPMMSGNIANAKRAEGVAACGAIRTAERCVKAETGNYVAFASGAWSGTALNNYLRRGDLNGKYYNDICFSVVLNGSGFDINANGNLWGLGAPTFNMLDDGSIT